MTPLKPETSDTAKRPASAREEELNRRARDCSCARKNSSGCGDVELILPRTVVDEFARNKARMIEESISALGTDFEWGMLNGKLSLNSETSKLSSCLLRLGFLVFNECLTQAGINTKRWTVKRVSGLKKPINALLKVATAG